MKEVKITLWYELQAKTSAATPFTQTYAITPSLSSEYSDVANLYDEIIVDDGRMQFLVRNDSDVPYSSDTGIQAFVIAYDPLDSTALGSVLNGLQHSQHILFAPPVSGPNGFQGAPLPHTKSGLYDFKWRVPKGTATRAAVATSLGHQWSDTADTTQNYGFFKMYFPSLGASGNVQMEMYCSINCRVRCRS
jgi:hypothetical protein